MTDTNDMLPSRLVRAVRLLQVFVLRFFDKNPLSQVQIILTSDGLAAPLTPLSGALSLLSLCPQQLLKPRPGNEASNIATIELRGVQLAIFFPPLLLLTFIFLLFFSFLQAAPILMSPRCDDCSREMISATLHHNCNRVQRRRTTESISSREE
jgi:hypothetical protein